VSPAPPPCLPCRFRDLALDLCSDPCGTSNRIPCMVAPPNCRVRGTAEIIGWSGRLWSSKSPTLTTRISCSTSQPPCSYTTLSAVLDTGLPRPSSRPRHSSPPIRHPRAYHTFPSASSIVGSQRSGVRPRLRCRIQLFGLLTMTSNWILYRYSDICDLCTAHVVSLYLFHLSLGG